MVHDNSQSVHDSTQNVRKKTRASELSESEGLPIAPKGIPGRDKAMICTKVQQVSFHLGSGMIGRWVCAYACMCDFLPVCGNHCPPHENKASLLCDSVSK